jgi:hypothetical protein
VDPVGLPGQRQDADAALLPAGEMLNKGPAVCYNERARAEKPAGRGPSPADPRLDPGFVRDMGQLCRFLLSLGKMNGPRHVRPRRGCRASPPVRDAKGQPASVASGSQE